MNTEPQSQQELTSFGYGFLGILIFSLTLPATRIAISGFDPVFVGLGRAIVAAGLSLILLAITRQRIPPGRFFPNFAIVAGGVVIGFPLLSAIAMRDAPASHGAVITGLLPLATAMCGVWRAGERPSLQFWIFASLGSALVICFALLSGGGSMRWADLAMLGAVGAAALGYAEGAVLARTFGSWQVICWALLLSTPLLLPIVWQHAPANFLAVAPQPLLGFLYVSVFSMFLGFFAWYRGLALGGIARIGQLQLIQPFFTIFFSVVLVGERVTIDTVGFAVAVMGCVILGKRTQITAKS
ncbi:DMT family transporter [Chamaesiphon sp. VAR_69_metabat_338]|uniref:DMT family transporter n=1 Tax=Chamaesiphon sp. VAR_69_metabat_338 TaxID=2964704 RepID=UPI00286EA17C|nr:DMT family transporter [Chamaesiphon sp. VAR_69_metabat_338]